jgi:tetratricopeptide (TPR) repeat protein
MTHFVVGEMYAGGGSFEEAVLHYKESLRFDEDAIEVWTALGRSHLALGEIGEAAAAAERAAALENDNKAAARLLANVRWAQGRIDEAIVELKHVMELDPEDLEAQFRLGMLLVRSERVEEGAEILDGVQGRPALEPRMLIEVARAYAAVGDHERAIEAYKILLSRRPKSAQALREVAQEYFHVGMREEAMAALERVVSLRPGDLGSWQRLLGLYVEDGDLAQAFVTTEEILRRDSTDVYVRKHHAVLLEQMGNPEAALEEWRHLTRLAPDDPLAWEQLGVRLWRTHETRDAADAFGTALGLNPDEIRLHHTLGSLYVDAEMYPEALDLLERSARRFPSNPGIEFLTGVAESRSGSPEEGLIHLRRSLELDPDREDVLFEIGMSLEALDRPDESAQAFRRIIEINPENAQAYNYLGYMYAELGIHLEEASALVKKALELEPQNPSYLDSLGWVFFKQGRLTAAEPLLRQAADLDPDEPVIHEHLGAVYYKLGREKEARDSWERALELDPENEAIAEQLREMEEESVR